MVFIDSARIGFLVIEAGLSLGLSLFNLFRWWKDVEETKNNASQLAGMCAMKSLGLSCAYLFAYLTGIGNPGDGDFTVAIIVSGKSNRVYIVFAY